MLMGGGRVCLNDEKDVPLHLFYINEKYYLCFIFL